MLRAGIPYRYSSYIRDDKHAGRSLCPVCQIANPISKLESADHVQRGEQAARYLKYLAAIQQRSVSLVLLGPTCPANRLRRVYLRARTCYSSWLNHHLCAPINTCRSLRCKLFDEQEAQVTTAQASFLELYTTCICSIMLKFLVYIPQRCSTSNTQERHPAAVVSQCYVRISAVPQSAPPSASHLNISPGLLTSMSNHSR